MSWVPPYLAKPNCAQCSNRRVLELEISGAPLVVHICGLRDERRFLFRKNPPWPNSSNRGANCKRYWPSQAAAHPLGDDWVEFPNASLERTRKPKRQRNPNEQNK